MVQVALDPVLESLRRQQQLQPHLESDQGMVGGHRRFHYPHPIHSSWLKMVEIWFSILTSKVLRRGAFTSREHLAKTLTDFAKRLTDFVTLYNTTAHPFRCTHDARPLPAA